MFITVLYAWEAFGATLSGTGKRIFIAFAVRSAGEAERSSNPGHHPGLLSVPGAPLTLPEFQTNTPELPVFHAGRHNEKPCDAGVQHVPAGEHAFVNKPKKDILIINESLTEEKRA